MHNSTIFWGRQICTGWRWLHILHYPLMALFAGLNDKHSMLFVFFNISANNRLSNERITHSHQQIMSRAFKISFNNRNTLYVGYIYAYNARQLRVRCSFLLLLLFSRCYWQHFVLCSGFFLSCSIVFGYHFSSIFFTYTHIVIEYWLIAYIESNNWVSRLQCNTIL